MNIKKHLYHIFSITASAIAAAVLSAAVTVAACPAGSIAYADEADPGQQYYVTLFDSADGLTSIEVNAIAQTSDGYLWAGTYSGLYRYDGSSFSRPKLGEGVTITSVTALLVDSKGGLLIGTNDDGIYRYDPAGGSIVHYTKADGLSSDTIRSLCEAADGSLYVGTAGRLSVIGSDGSISSIDEEKTVYTNALAVGSDGTLAGVTYAGDLYFLEDGHISSVYPYEPSQTTYYYSLCSGPDGSFLAATDGSEIYKVSPGMEAPVLFADLGSTTGINSLAVETSAAGETGETGESGEAAETGYFVCADNGFGLLGADGSYTALETEQFDSVITCALRDRQGNLWYASNKHGLCVLTANPFKDITKLSSVGEHVVNAVLKTGDGLYIGTDDGLFLVDEENYHEKKTELTALLEGIRVRGVMEDSSGNIWISTYSNTGLVCLKPDGTIRSYNEANDGTNGNRFRFAMELSDGTIAAAEANGLTFIKNGRVAGTLGQADGLQVPQILSLAERPDGSLLAGSDGDGVYIIENGAVTGRIGSEEGLGSLIVLRIVPCEGDYLYVTGNGLYYGQADGTIRRLEHFPYSNNYDVCLLPDGTAWISGSAGIYVVRTDELLSDEDYSYLLLNSYRGLDTSLTANAWNELDSDEQLYLCCSSGVRCVSVPYISNGNADYNILVSRVTGDGAEITADEKGTYRVPAGVNRVEITPAILNFSMSNPRVHVFLEGFDDTGVTLSQKEMTGIAFTNLPYGTYTLRIQILKDLTREVEQEAALTIVKDAAFTERPSFQLLMIILFVLFLCFLTWSVSQSRSLAVIRRQNKEVLAARDEAEEANRAKSRFLARMSHEIRTPINTILGMDELILRDNPDGPVGRRAMDIRQAGSSLLAIINDMLDFSKIESGMMNLVEEDYNTVDLVSDLSRTFTERARIKGLALKTEIDPELPKRLHGDIIHLQQILTNLLSNALKYTNEGSIAMRLKLAERADDRCTLLCEVEDTGIGIREEDMDKLFGSFVRLDEERNAHIQGTGLGLAITSELLEIMGSELLVQSEYGKGSRFFFEISQLIKDGDTVGETALQDDANAPAPLGAGAPYIAPDARVLAVDDNEMNLRVLRGLLDRLKLSLDTAGSGEEALKTAKEKAYDLILMDHMMPGMDGIEAFHLLRKTDGPNRETPVIILTANAIVGAQERYLSEGFTDYLSKPLTGEALENMLRKHLPADKIQEPDAAPAEDAAEAQDTDTGVDAGSAAAAGTGAGISAAAGTINKTDTAAAPAAATTTAAGAAAGTISATDTGAGAAKGTDSAEDAARKAEADLIHSRLNKPDARELKPAYSVLASLNVNNGLRFAGSDPEFFDEILRMYLDEAEEHQFKLAQMYTDGDWKNYTVQVHALKTNSRNIGADTLGSEAEQLEYAGKAGNHDYIKSHHESTMELYRQVLCEIRTYLDEIG